MFSDFRSEWTIPASLKRLKAYKMDLTIFLNSLASFF